MELAVTELCRFTITYHNTHIAMQLLSSISVLFTTLSLLRQWCNAAYVLVNKQCWYTDQSVHCHVHTCQYCRSMKPWWQEFQPENFSSSSLHATHCALHDPDNMSSNNMLVQHLSPQTCIIYNLSAVIRLSCTALIAEQQTILLMNLNNSMPFELKSETVFRVSHAH